MFEKFFTRSSVLGLTLMLSIPAFAAAYSIPEDFRVEPSPGSTVDAIMQITVVNTEGDEISNSGSRIKINGKDYASSPKVDYNRVTFVLDTPITDAGEYEVVIPQGRIQDEDWNDIDEFQFTLYIAGGENPGDDPAIIESVIPKGFTVSPAPGSEVESISEIKLVYFDDFTDLSLVKKVIQIDGKDVSINGFGDFGELTITLINRITEAGEHVVVIPAGTFELDSMDGNEMFRFTLKVTGSGSSDEPGDDEPGDDEPGKELAGIPSGFYVTPGKNATVDELSVITIVDDYYGDMSVNDGAKLYIDGISVEYTAVIEGEYDDTLIITLADKVTKAGEHTVQLPAGFFNYMYSSASKEFGWRVTVEGGDSPDMPEPGVTVVPEGVTVTPEPGSKVASINSVTVSIDGWGDLYYMDLDYILVNGEQTSVKDGYGDPMEIKLSAPISEAGTYWITIPANSIMNDFGKYLDSAIQFSITVEDLLNGVDGLEVPGEWEVEIFTLDGIRTWEIQSGRLYIVRKGTEVSKTVIK